VFSFPSARSEFYYADKIYRHPLGSEDAPSYSASCIVIHGRCWIALFDDCGLIRNGGVDIEAMNDSIAAGKDPVTFFPELMWLRACLDSMPHSLLVVNGGDHRARGVMFVPPLQRPPQLEPRAEDLALFYAAVGIDAHQ
jgi:hypothetical protein